MVCYACGCTEVSGRISTFEFCAERVLFVGVLVDKLNLVNKTQFKTLNNIVPDCWIYVQDTGIKLGRIQIFNNWSPYLVKDVDNKVWIGLEYFCNETDDFWNMSEQECIDFAADELIKMGADINTDGQVAVIKGVEKLYAAPVYASDLRSGAALVVASLAAEGETKIYNTHFIDRGYEDFENNLCMLNADIYRKVKTDGTKEKKKL